MPITITGFSVRDIRFPTSRTLAGSDAMNKDPDYSAAYLVLHTDSPEGLEGHGLAFTIGRASSILLRVARSGELDHVLGRGPALHDLLQPVAPGVQGAALLGIVAVAIIDARHATFGVIEQLGHNQSWDAHCGDMTGSCPS